MEDVLTTSGAVEQQFVPHNFSPEQATQIIVEMLKALSVILTPGEMKDLAEILGKELAELLSVPDTEAAAAAHLGIREVL